MKGGRVVKRIRLLYVCTGNTCRSPMAAALTAQLGKELALPFEVEVRSRGLYAVQGDPLSQYAREALGERGIAVEHEAAMLEEEDLKWADLVLTMTMQHKRHLWEEFPDYQDKTFTLKEYILEQEGSGKGLESSEPEADEPHGTKDGKMEMGKMGRAQEGTEEPQAEGFADPETAGQAPDDFSWEYLQPYFSSIDVRDPFGGELEDYRRTRDELEESIRRLLHLLAAPVGRAEDTL